MSRGRPRPSSAHADTVVPSNIEQFPAISFRSTAVHPDGDGWLVRGDVTAHGTTRAVDVAVDGESGTSGDLTVHALAELDRHDFGVTGAKGVAGRHVGLEFDLRAVAVDSSSGAAPPAPGA